MLNKDFDELLSIFNEYGVKYLIVGGYAVAVHAQPRATKDLDLLIQPNPENGKAVYAALAKFGAPLAGLTAEDFIQPGKFFRMGSAPVMVDIFPGIDGVTFEHAWERRLEVVVDTASGLKAFFISGPDLIKAKLAAARPQDIADVHAIRKAQQARLKRDQVDPKDLAKNDRAQ